MGAIGLGAVGGAVLLPKLKARSDANKVVLFGELGTAIALVLFGLAQQPTLAVLACLIAGVSWTGQKNARRASHCADNGLT